MNKQSKDGNISWTDYTWNPIKGLCPIDCKLPDGRGYCYARAMYKQFKMNPEIRFTLDNSNYTDRFSNKLKLPAGTKVFICSTFEMFHQAVKEEWRDVIFLIIEKNPNLTFQILTKMPENIDRPMPDNVHLGVSVTKNDDWWRAEKLQEHSIKAKIKFLSLEPLLEHVHLKVLTYIDWLIVGKLKGYGSKYKPSKDWLKEYVFYCETWKKPIFLKNNLKEIWGENLTQEFPR